MGASSKPSGLSNRVFSKTLTDIEGAVYAEKRRAGVLYPFISVTKR
ncbi:MAG: hypothetical protein NWF14_00410 [Candidatus Bathyarchaeota archaeon]|nr:hypothetical protein [Candidatus Bathyarchaeota archaeon]